MAEGLADETMAEGLADDEVMAEELEEHQVMAEGLADDEVIIRLWTGGALPDFAAAKSWSKYAQEVYTDRTDFPVFCDNAVEETLAVYTCDVQTNF